MTNKNKKFLFLSIAFVMLVMSFVFVTEVFAQSEVTEGLDAVGGQIGLTAEDPRLIVARIIRVILGFVGVVALSVVIYGGFLYMTSGGAEDSVRKAKKVIFNGLIGLVIIILSFAITSYVITTISDVAGINGGGGTGEDTGGGGGGGGLGGSATEVFNVNISPSGENRPLNTQITISLPSGKTPLPDENYKNVSDSIKIYKVVEVPTAEGETPVPAEQTEVGGTFSVTDNVITFVPASDCLPDSGCQAGKCFDKQSDYLIKLTKLQSADPLTVSCPNEINGYCLQQTFSTGDACDTNAPTVDLVPYFPVKQNDVANVYGAAADDLGLDFVRFCGDFAKQPGLCEDVATVNNQKSFSQTFNVDTNNFDLGVHDAMIKAFDMAGQNTMATESYLVASANCFGPSGFNCENEGCELNDNCDGSDYCVINAAEIICSGWKWPLIKSLSTQEGPIGTYVTITGKNFGVYDSRNSKVLFFDDKTAELPCGGLSWSDTQVVVKVPEGATTGALRLINNKNEYYDTLDPKAPGVKGPFTITAGAPITLGLCSVLNQKTKVASAIVGELVVASGDNFGTQGETDKVYFNGLEASYLTSWADKKIDGIKVPLSSPGSIQVQVGKGEIYSNPVYLTVTEPKSDIIINSVKPNPAAPNQYITISGKDFSSSGAATLEAGDQKYPLVMSCTGAWQDTQIVTAIPAAVPNGDYKIKITNNNGASATADFKVDNTLPVTPNICELKPNNGPAGTQITIFGESFGSTAGKVVFSGGEVISNFDWQDQVISKVIVPPSVKTGAVYVQDKNGQKSNSVIFTAGKCQAGSCPTGEVCCQNQYCSLAADCEVPAATSCSYSWYFSTGTLPKVPRVIERSCSDAHDESPSPTKGSLSACPNGEISFTFNQLMNPLSFKDKIIIKKWAPVNNVCNLSDCLDANNCTTIYDEGLVHDDQDFKETTYPTKDDKVTQVVLNQYLGVEPNFCYQVTVKSGVYSAASAEEILPADYTWQFKTQNDNCAINKVLISPDQGLIKEIYQTQKFEISGQSENCGILDVSQYNWTWTNNLYKDRIQKVASPDFTSNIAYFGLITTAAQLETTANEPEVINASGTIGDKNFSSAANLVVKFSEPFVIDYYPNCNEACKNIFIGATFNTLVREADIKNINNFKLYKCLDKACQNNLTEVSFTSNDLTGIGCYTFNGVGYCSQVRLATGNSLLLPATYYRVVIKKDIESISNYNLINLNYSDAQTLDAAGKPIADSFSWLFKTRDSNELCAVDRVGVTPVEYKTNVKDQTIEYFADAYGAADACSAQGQKLDSYQYSWDWLTDKTNLVSISTTKYSDEKASGCTDKCLNTGSNKYAAVCGNDEIEIGEECDDKNINDGDGCSSGCLREGVVGGTCGNGTVEAGEECDSPGSLGCSEKCLNLGSAAAGFVCGNGLIQFGEDADFGSTAMNQKYGLTSDCLYKGSTYTTDDQLSICGNGIIEAGEECEFNAADCKNPKGELCTFGEANCLCGFEDNAICSDTCLNKGSSACAQETALNCCGNGTTEKDAGEDCDDKNLVSGDGCDYKCLNEGSSYKYSSYCNDKTAGTGEDVACESGTLPVTPLTSPYAIIKVLGNLVAGQTYDIAKIMVSAQNLAGQGTLEYLINVDGGLEPPIDGPDEEEECEADVNIIKSPATSDFCINGALEIVFSSLVKSSVRTGAITADNISITKAGVRFKVAVAEYQTNQQTGLFINLINDAGEPVMFEESTEYVLSFSNFTNRCVPEADQSFASIKFTTGSEVCQADSAGVSPQQYTFTSKYESYILIHRYLYSKGTPILSYPNKYSWTWANWNVEKPNLFEVVKDNGYKLTQKNINGQATVSTIATITKDIYFNTLGKTFIGVGNFSVAIPETEVCEAIVSLEKKPGDSPFCINGIIDLEFSSLIKSSIGSGQITDANVLLVEKVTRKQLKVKVEEYDIGNRTLLWIYLVDNAGNNIMWAKNTEYELTLKNLSNRCVPTQTQIFDTINFKTGNNPCQAEKAVLVPDSWTLTQTNETKPLGRALMSKGSYIGSIVGEYNWSWTSVSVVDTELFSVNAGFVLVPKNKNGQTTASASATITQDIYFNSKGTKYTASGLYAVNLPQTCGDITSTTQPLDQATKVCANSVLEINFTGIVNFENAAYQISLKNEKTGSMSLVRGTLSVTDGKTKLSIYPIDDNNNAAALDKDTKYSLAITGLVNACGGAVSFSTISFTTGDFCHLDEVVLDPPEHTFTDETESLDVEHLAKSDEQTIQPIEDVYDWEWQDETGHADCVLADENLLDAVNNQDVGCTLSPNENVGETENTSTVRITTDTYFQESSPESPRYVSGSGLYGVDICQNHEFFELSTKNVKFDVCYDFGDSNNKTDDLPKLEMFTTPNGSNGYFLMRDKSVEVSTESSSVSDAIAIRIYSNEKNLSARQWYEENVPNKGGSLSDVKVDCNPDGGGQESCYYGVRDGNTWYISAGNIVDVPPGQLVNNIYVIGYSVNSNSNTVNLFTQLLDSLTFTTNYSNYAQVAKRDIKRVNDVNYWRQLLNNYYTVNGTYPKLDSGTYQRGMVLSVWPSWQSVFGTLLGASLPVDPINKLYTYEPSQSYFGSACMENGIVPKSGAYKCDKAVNEDQCYLDSQKGKQCSICAVGSDINTCYNSSTFKVGLGNGSDISSIEQELFDFDSYIYGYSYIDNNHAKMYYKYEGISKDFYKSIKNQYTSSLPQIITP